jgi:hypothetical protein
MTWDKIVKKLIFLRKQLVLIFTLSFYFLSIYYFFIDPKILIGLVFAIFFFVLAHYFMIEIKKADVSNIII